MIDQAADWGRVVRALYSVAMAVFLVTIAIGILNGLDLYEFNHDEILTHVHSGTLGWISLGIVAATTWFARGIDRRLPWALGILIPIYVAAFYIAQPTLRMIAGALVLIAIVWLLIWVWRYASGNPSMPALAIALGLTTFTYGAVIGVLRQIQLGGGPSLFPPNADPVGAHASAMVFSYLILVAMGLLEWRLLGTTGRTRAGLVQVLGLFTGGLIISGALLFLTPEQQQPAAGLYLLVELIAVIVFAVRVVPTAVRVDWAGPSPRRHLAAAALFVPIATVIFLIVIYRFVTDPSLTSNPEPVIGILTASDHAAFIGVITNIMLALMLTLAADRGEHWPWADQLIFWGVNLGLLIFIVGLVGDAAVIKRVGAPLMGVSLLLGLATAATRLWSSDLREPSRADAGPSDLRAAEPT